MTPEVWDKLREFFTTDDGSLPEVCIRFDDGVGVSKGYALLRSRARGAVTEDPTFWSVTHGEDRPIDSVANAADFVLSGEAESFHLVLGGIEIAGTVLPDLGVRVHKDELDLDYRMGKDWGEAEVEAFFTLIAELCELDPASSVSLEDGRSPEAEKRFGEIWREWGEQRALEES